nr:Uncharacterised protein [Klebsiella pneumoniae]
MRGGLRPVAVIKSPACGFHRPFDVGFFTAGDRANVCCAAGSIVSKVVLSAAAQYSPLINKRVSMAGFSLFPASKPVLKIHHDSLKHYRQINQCGVFRLHGALRRAQGIAYPRS